jgi:hypothetical protein
MLYTLAIAGLATMATAAPMMVTGKTTPVNTRVAVC